jgi:two-component system chemotaxis response regulator CheB
MVQNPATAFSSSMPQSAITHVDVDYVTTVAEMPPLLVSLVNGARREEPIVKPDEPIEKRLSGLTCPECRGPLSQVRQGRIIEYSCRVGHAYSPLTLARGHHETVERTLWATLVALEEAADINDRVAPESLEQRSKTRIQIKVIKALLDEHLAIRNSD